MEKKKVNLVICILLILLVVAVCYIGYDKLIKKGNSSDGPINTHSEVFKAIRLTTADQTIQLKNSTLIVHVEKDDINGIGRLYINDSLILKDESDALGIAVETAYYTDDFVFFTLSGQSGNYISYALNDEGDELMIFDNGYQMNNIKYENNKIVANGFNAVSDPEGKSPLKLLIKYDKDEFSITIEPYK